MQQKIGERYRWGATPLSLAKLQGQGSAVKNWRAATAGGLPLYLWEKCRGKAVQQKLASATAGGLPSIFGKNAGAGQCSKKLERAFGKMQRQGSAVKNWRALPLGGYPSILQEQGSAVKIWRALPLGGDPCIFEKNMGALIPTKTPLAKPLSDLPIINHLGSGIPCTSSRLCFPLPLPRPTE